MHPLLLFVNRLALLVAPIACAAVVLNAQHAAHSIPVVPQALLERAIILRTGIGEAHHAVATKSAEAQRFYDQGLAYLHSYVWIDAARSFHQALRHDPSLALAHVGLSVAYVEVNKPADARAALERARGSAAKLPDHDRRHVDARALQMDAEANPRDVSRLSAYRQALDEAIATHPADIEFLLLRGIAESPDPADRGQGSVQGSIAYLEKARTLVPTHFAAQHYLTHAYENMGRVGDALASAAVYAQRAAPIPHARHMHGHNLRRAGRTVEAIAEFEAADRLHREHFTRESVAAAYDWHFAHNLDLLGSSRRFLGQMKQAGALIKQSFDLPSNLVVQVYNKRDWPGFLRARGRLAEALAAARQLAAHPHPLAQAAGHIEAGYTLMAMGRWGDAANESNTALRILRAGAEAGPIAAPALLGLQGEIALRTADREKGRRLLLDTANRVRAVPGPDGWVQALFALESMARTARQVGDWQLAGQLAQQMLAHDPAYAGTHYALALVAEHDGDAKTARAEFARAQKYWSQADADLPELVEIRKRLK
jgi:tetratricopeptide (TPR) repeat protein